jgi:hypothetical protein
MRSRAASFSRQWSYSHIIAATGGGTGVWGSTNIREELMHGAARLVGISIAVAALLSAGAAQAQRGGFAGPNELSGTMGPSFGLTDYAPGGFKLQNEYGYRLSERTWFNVQLNFTLGGDTVYGGRCWDPHNHIYYVCDQWSGFSGDAIELIAGVKLKWPRGRLLPYAKFGGGLAFSWWNGFYGGTALVFRGGGGVKYYVLRQLAVGGEVMLSIGPDFGSDNVGGGVHAYAALDILGGIEFNF